MLEIHSCKDIYLYSSYINEHKLPKEVEIAEAFDKDKVIGFGIFEYDIEVVKLYAVECEEPALFDGIVRTILFKASIKGIDRAEFLVGEREMESLYTLGILKNGEKTLQSIQEIMGGCKNCK